MPFNFTELVESTVHVGSGAQVLDAATANFYTAALDEAKKVLAQVPTEGANYFRVRNVDKNNYSSQKIHGIGLAEVNSDLEDLPLDKQLVGFEQTISNFVMRKAMAIGREALETDRHGVIGDHARNLLQCGNKTTEIILADVFNRGFGTLTPTSVSYTSNLSLLCEDGLALFSGERPQVRPTAADWSNLRTTGSLTADAVAAARLAFRKYVDANGDLAPQKLEKVIVSPDLEDTMRKISGSTLSVGTSLNDTNVVAGTPYECWSYLSPNTVIFMGDGENELEFHVRHNPKVETYNDGSNIDKIISRLYMALGTGCFRPGKFIGQKTA